MMNDSQIPREKVVKQILFKKVAQLISRAFSKEEFVKFFECLDEDASNDFYAAVAEQGVLIAPEIFQNHQIDEDELNLVEDDDEN